jgi:hypothetical protein
VFVFVARERETLSVRQLDRITTFLQCLAPFVEQQDSGCGLSP